MHYPPAWKQWIAPGLAVVVMLLFFQVRQLWIPKPPVILPPGTIRTVTVEETRGSAIVHHQTITTPSVLHALQHRFTQGTILANGIVNCPGIAVPAGEHPVPLPQNVIVQFDYASGKSRAFTMACAAWYPLHAAHPRFVISTATVHLLQSIVPASFKKTIY